MNQLFDEPVWLGVDLGTQSVRAVAISATGELAGSGVAKLTSHREGGRHEQDPEEWWSAVAVAARAASRASPRRPFAGSRWTPPPEPSCSPIGKEMRSRPGLMYDDSRATGEAQVVNRNQHGDSGDARL